MSRIVLVASLVAAVVLAACGAAPNQSPSSPSASPPIPSQGPTAAPSPVVTPPPSVEPPDSPAPSAPASPEPTAPTFSDAERYLLDGVLRGAIDCEPARDDLPTGAIAGIECDSPESAVARIGFYLFENDADMLDAYLARMTAEGVTLDSGGCVDGESEGAYTPGEGTVPYRDGCFINDEGFANYRATLPGAHVYIGILGRSADTGALQSFAWLGSQDTPGNPTLWGEPT